MKRSVQLTPKISVIIPAYNEEKYLEACLLSLEKQTIPKDNYEIIVVDNNSNDKTVTIAKKYNVKVLSFSESNSVGAVREYGVLHAKGSILVFIDADIRIPESWLNDVYALLSRQKYLCIGGRTTAEKATIVAAFLFNVMDIAIRITQALGKCLLWGSNMAITKETYHAVGGFDTKLRMAEDWDLTLRIQEKFGKSTVKYFPELAVKSSIRKQDDFKTIILYSIHGFYNYLNIVILGRKKTTNIIYKR